jgi:hypothetical protein
MILGDQHERLQHTAESTDDETGSRVFAARNEGLR